MKLIENLPHEIKGKWLIHYALYECPECQSHFKANTNDIKRNRVRHCGCSKWNRPIENEINGYKIKQDLGVVNGRKRCVVICPACGIKEYEVSAEALRRNIVRKSCGCKPASKGRKKSLTITKTELKKMEAVKRGDIIREIRKKNKPLIALKNRIRSLIRRTMAKRNYTKNSSTYSILGCTYEEFMLHIEGLFIEGMSWDNRAHWHIDHIIPCVSANNEDELLKLNHYTNLRPLWAKENMKKGSKILTGPGN